MRKLGGTTVLAAVAILAACETPTQTTVPDVVTYSSHLAFDCSSQTSIPEAECAALVALYNSTDGDNWSDNEGWLVDADPCVWDGVACEEGSVVEVNLIARQLSGPVPPELADLSSLRLLNLQGNQLTGSIPAELGDLASLERLNLNFNQLTGPIPPELGNMTSLEVLWLPFNQLTGSIPPELGNLANLTYILLRDNQLTGPIPPELSNLTELEHLIADFNQLTGTIPPELGQLSNLRNLWLGLNELSGPIPSELGDLTNLDGLLLLQNQLSGLVPLAVAQVGATLGSLCRLEDNPDLYIPDTEAYRDADLDGDGFICGLPLTAVPSEIVAEDLQESVAQLEADEVLNGGQANALGEKLDRAVSMLETGADRTALNLLRAFINQVGSLVDEGVLTEAEGTELMSAAQALQELIQTG